MSQPRVVSLLENIMEGWLELKGSKIKGWKRVHARVESGHLVLDKGKGGELAIDLRGCRVGETRGGGDIIGGGRRDYCFSIVHPERGAKVLQARSGQDMADWVRSLQGAVYEAGGEGELEGIRDEGLLELMLENERARFELFHAKSQLEKVRVEVSASRVDDESIMPTTMSASLHSGTSFLGHRDHNSESIRGSGVLLGSQGSLAAGDDGSVRLVPYDRDGVALAGALDAVADASDKHNAQLVRLQAEQGAKTAAAAQEAFAAVRRERDAGQRATEGWLMAEEARRVAEARVAELELALCDAEGEALERELRAKAMAESAAAKSLIESAESVERWQDRCKVSEGYVKQLREELLRTEKREEDAIVRLEKSDKEAARLAAALSDLERDIQGEARRRAVAIFQAEQIKGVKSRERSPGMGRLGAIASRDVGCQTEASVESQVSEASRRLVASAEAMDDVLMERDRTVSSLLARISQLEHALEMHQGVIEKQNEAATIAAREVESQMATLVATADVARAKAEEELESHRGEIMLLRSERQDLHGARQQLWAVETLLDKLVGSMQRHSVDSDVENLVYDVVKAIELSDAYQGESGINMSAVERGEGLMGKLGQTLRGVMERMADLRQAAERESVEVHRAMDEWDSERISKEREEMKVMRLNALLVAANSQVRALNQALEAERQEANNAKEELELERIRARQVEQEASRREAQHTRLEATSMLIQLEGMSSVESVPFSLPSKSH